MPVNRPSMRACWPLVVAIVCGLPISVVAGEPPSVDHELRAPFAMQYSIQSGDRLLAPVDRDTHEVVGTSFDALQLATYSEPIGDESPRSDSHEPAKLDTTDLLPSGDETNDDAAGEGLFQSMATDGSNNWSTALDSAAEDRVDSAIRATGFAILLLGIALVGFLGWHRMRGSKLSAPAETSELLERGRLPITQTCRLHLVRAGGCDVLIAVDRGSVRAMTPLPGDFSQLTSLPFDAPAEISLHTTR